MEEMYYNRIGRLTCLDNFFRDVIIELIHDQIHDTEQSLFATGPARLTEREREFTMQHIPKLRLIESMVKSVPVCDE